MQNLSEKRQEELPKEPVDQISQLYSRDIDLMRGQFKPKIWKLCLRIVVDEQPVVAVAGDLTPVAARMAKSHVLRRLREEVGDIN
jgi:RNA polymerase sigma-70 factor (ECF subfamily)